MKYILRFFLWIFVIVTIVGYGLPFLERVIS